ncbi:hypothetical protein [Arsenophonus endosymbiont of Aleurodicus floccissimus]|uniref:hypothetical protein n=1 Tax=Arsenophonus endosymbiont of Aleurodicus floccissimus TaxID=2152761 RepID=UPI0011C46D4E|nr:hypothetical protein [Arsenophonus endosymbiont of Aleurodicus floccissimus]
MKDIAQCTSFINHALNKLSQFKAADRIESDKPIEQHIKETLSNTGELLKILSTLIINIGNCAVDKLKDDLRLIVNGRWLIIQTPI